MRSRSLAASPIEEPTVNLTPLIDVVFVVLIMFIVIAPLLEQDRVELAQGPHLPMQTAKGVQESSPITIHVHRDNTIWFNHQPTDPVRLKGQLIQARTAFPKVIPQVFHDKQAHFGTYQSVKNAAEEAGYDKMDLILKPS
ncbi:MAG: biopolymer transporter ExbD [Parachlamydia sp.]|jgi:biopolymer transport protein ExbD|nr:biopolymer transporter ExbD [Parachlamydia sp.]